MVLAKSEPYLATMVKCGGPRYKRDCPLVKNEAVCETSQTNIKGNTGARTLPRRHYSLIIIGVGMYSYPANAKATERPLKY